MHRLIECFGCCPVSDWSPNKWKRFDKLRRSLEIQLYPGLKAISAGTEYIQRIMGIKCLENKPGKLQYISPERGFLQDNELTETHKRTIARAVCWRIIATVVTAIWAGWSGAIWANIVLTVLHYAYERPWLRIKWGAKESTWSKNYCQVNKNKL